jgi:hypothetical protein
MASITAEKLAVPSPLIIPPTPSWMSKEVSGFKGQGPDSVWTAEETGPSALPPPQIPPDPGPSHG